MSFIKDLLKGMSEDKKEVKLKFKEAQQNEKVQHMLEERKKSANQRELEKYVKDQKEKEIKKVLDKIHKKQNADAWKGKSILKNQKNILHEDKKVFSNDKSILKQKNIFLDHKSNNPITRKETFKGW